MRKWICGCNKEIPYYGLSSEETNTEVEREETRRKAEREREMAATAENRKHLIPPPPPPLSHYHQGGRAPPPPPSSSRQRPEPVDREKTCPLLLRVFTKVGGHHTKEDFAVRGKEPKEEVQIYTWKDATLRELADLVKEVAPAARRRDAKLSFAFVFPTSSGRYMVKPVGTTQSFVNGKHSRFDDNKTLAELSFQIGDYLDVAIL